MIYILAGLAIMVMAVAILKRAQPRATRSFQMKVEDVFSLAGLGSIVTGRVSMGTVAKGDRVLIKNPNGDEFTANVVKVQLTTEGQQAAKAGDNVAIALDVDKDRLFPGAIVTR